MAHPSAKVQLRSIKRPIVFYSALRSLHFHPMLTADGHTALLLQVQSRRTTEHVM